MSKVIEVELSPDLSKQIRSEIQQFIGNSNGIFSLITPLEDGSILVADEHVPNGEICDGLPANPIALKNIVSVAFVLGEGSNVQCRTVNGRYRCVRWGG